MNIRILIIAPVNIKIMIIAPVNIRIKIIIAPVTIRIMIIIAPSAKKTKHKIMIMLIIKAPEDILICVTLASAN